MENFTTTMEAQQPEHVVLPSSLEDAKIVTLPDSAYYISEFISADEERMLLTKIATTPKPKWKQLSHRRLQTWPSDLTRNTLLDSPLPRWLTDPVIPRLQSIAGLNSHIFAASPHSGPNHVLINEYLPGQGIMPHKDGSVYHPVVCTISLGAPLCLGIYKAKEDGGVESEPRWRILQEPRSLLITSEKLYTDYLHGIAEITEDQNLNSTTVSNWDLMRSHSCVIEGSLQRDTRTSLTYRDVLKVSSLGTKFAMFGK